MKIKREVSNSPDEIYWAVFGLIVTSNYVVAAATAAAAADDDDDDDDGDIVDYFDSTTLITIPHIIQKLTVFCVQQRIGIPTFMAIQYSF